VGAPEAADISGGLREFRGMSGVRVHLGEWEVAEDEAQLRAHRALDRLEDGIGSPQ
jgi:hypothetical protein